MSCHYEHDKFNAVSVGPTWAPTDTSIPDSVSKRNWVRREQALALPRISVFIRFQTRSRFKTYDLAVALNEDYFHEIVSCNCNILV